MKLKAYAKLNLALEIVGRTANGMHELDMLMQSISLFDEVTITKAEQTRLRCDGMEADEKNTALRAARAFFEYTGICGGADISLEKHIPSQAGLGGGSSDAGAVLCALDLLYETKLKKEELIALGVKIGADVPFFIEGGCARARGVGEILAPVENNCGFSYLLVKPGGGVPTGPAFAKYHELPAEHADIEAAAHALCAGNAAAYFRAAGNALLSAGLAICPQVGEIIAACKAYGAEFAMMTGSGSCVFAVFMDQAAKDRALAAFSAQYPFCEEAENTAAGYEIIGEDA